MPDYMNIFRIAEIHPFILLKNVICMWGSEGGRKWTFFCLDHLIQRWEGVFSLREGSSEVVLCQQVASSFLKCCLGFPVSGSGWALVFTLLVTQYCGGFIQITKLRTPD